MSIADCSTTEAGKSRTYRTFCKSISTKKVVNNPTIEELITDLNSYKTGDVKKTINTLLLRLSIAVKKLGGQIDTKNNKTIVDSIKDSLPDPDNKGTTINTSERKLEKIIKTITDIVNDDIFTTSVIDNQKQGYEIVKDINQYLYDLSCSINSELEYIKNIVTVILDKFSSTKSVELLKRIETSVSVIDEHQMSIDKELKQHLSKYDKINEDIETEDLELHCNSIARILGSIKHLAVIAYLYDTIIEAVSSEFPNMKEINKEIKRLTRLAKKDKQLDITVTSIKKYFYKRKIIGGGDVNFDIISESENSSLLGGSINEPGQFLEGGRIELDGLTPEQIERNKKMERAKIVIREYVAEMNIDINEFIEHIYEASKYMGVTTYDVSKLKDHLEDMKWIEGLREPNIYLSMVGYHLDDSYRTMSAQYEDRLKKTARGLKDLGKAIPGTSSHLNKASANVMSIIKTVDHFKDLLKTLLVGVCLSDIRDVVAEVPHAMGNIELALNRLYHALNIAQMRKMIKKSSTDLCNYSKNYPELLALVVGARRADLEREYQILVADCPVGQNQRIDPLTGRVLNPGLLDPANAVDISVDAPLRGEALSDGEAYARLRAEIASPGGISTQICSLSWKYKNLAKTACNRSNLFTSQTVNGVQLNAAGTRTLETLLRTPKYIDNFTKLLKEIEGEFRAKHRLYKSMESLDLLLSSFTKEIAGDVDLMKEVKHYLEDTKVYTKWFTDYTGDLLVSVFEGMPAYVNYAEPNIGGIPATGNPTPEQLDTYLQGPKDKRTVYKFTPPTQDFPARYQNYVGTTEYNSLSEDLKNPICISFYYKQLAKTIYEAGGLPVYGKATGVACMKGAGKVRKTIDEFYNNFQALKNIFHSFITLYNRIISKGVRSKALMSPSQIYYSILSYLKQSALARRLQPGDERCHNQCEGTIGFVTPEKKGYPKNIPYRSHWYTSLVGMILPSYYPTGQEFGCYSIQDRTGYPTAVVNQQTGNLKRFNKGVGVVDPFLRVLLRAQQVLLLMT